MDKDERRRNTRVQFRTSADVTFGEKTYPDCETSDLSINGVFISGLDEHKPGEKCTLVLRLHGGDTSLKIEVKGEATRLTAKGIAIHFSEMDLDSFQHLRNIVYYNADNPDKVSDEYLDHSLKDLPAS